jgi:hypothetical protein
MTDTLIVLPTIGANVGKAAEVLLQVAGLGDRYSIVDDATSEREWVVHRVSEFVDHHAEGRRGLVAAYRVGFDAFANWTTVNDTPYRRLVLLEDGLVLTDAWATFDALTRTLDAHPEFGWVACGQLENEHAPFTSLCSMLTRECALALDGGPDLAFAPCQFDDGDLFMRALKAGFRPHAVPHKVSHPEARTSRVGTIEDDWQLIEAHRAIFRDRWGLYDFPWAQVPVHRGCGKCG